MSYRSELMEKVRSKEYLPNFEKTNFLPELMNLAGEAEDHKNIHGCLAAVLIYHQMKEEILKALFRKAQFYTQLSSLPKEVIFTEENYFKSDYFMLKYDVIPDFKNRDEIMKLSKELDCIKSVVVNKLSKKCGSDEIAKYTAQAKDLFDQIFTVFRDINLWFYVQIRKLDQAE